MKTLSAGLTFVNISTVCGLLLGIAFNGLGLGTATLSLIFGGLVAIATYLKTADPEKPKNANGSDSSNAGRYQSIWLWGLGVCFVMFAARSFLWLLYIDSAELRIQSPNNLGDLALHITYIKHFASGVALWPDNPIYAFSKLRYPAGIDLFNALLCLVDVDLIRGLVWVGLLASIATFYAFYRWGRGFAIAGFLFNGGLAGFQFIRTWHFEDYQGKNDIAWKSIPLAMFVTQRGLLYAIPAGLLLLWHWRQKFFRNAAVAGVSDHGYNPLPFWIELSLYASMPLFHMHTFIALSIVLVFLLFFGDAAMQRHAIRLVASAFVPATFFVWLITDHFHAGSVLKWYPGWVLHDKNDFAHSFFWLYNFGILVPLLVALLGLVGWSIWKSEIRWRTKAPEDFVFLAAATAIFLLVIFVKLAPWEWDNLKVLIWAYFLVLPLLWSGLIAHWAMPVRIAVCIALFGSGFVSLIGGLAAGKPGYGFANRSELDGVGAAVRNLPLNARFAAFPVFNHPLLLQGRKVVLGYGGHLWTQGFDYGRENDKLTDLMNGGNWREDARQLRARYIFWGNEEGKNYPESTRPWETSAPKVASGAWGAIYDLEPLQPHAPSTLKPNATATP